MTYLGSYRGFREDALTAAFAGRSAESVRRGHYRQLSQELWLAYNEGGPFRFQTGSYFFLEKTKLTAAFLNLLPGVPFAGFVDNPTKSLSIGIFGEATYSPLEALRLTIGARYTDDRKSRVGTTTRQQAPIFNSATDIASANDARTSSNKLTWRAVADYDLNSRSLLYASISTGYKSGGGNNGCDAGAPGCLAPLAPSALYYEPETLTSYEVGLKTNSLMIAFG
ncbi:TonB-dependent receptor [Sphingobium sp. HWE2-09]|uniref:TonB-dependent receptor n=1 Tax=Sphingobium sp. HWE2-09 TaxID=3108390 RepID=UPI002DD01BAC|nr:TonB-dependent receptor [Sphingobium sp. HWE2-09]